MTTTADSTEHMTHRVRYANFMALFEKFKEDYWAAHPNERRTDHGMLERFSDHVGISAKFMSHVKRRYKNIGGTVARKIEAAFGVEEGWLDLPQEGIFSGNPGLQRFLRVMSEIWSSASAAERAELENLAANLGQGGPEVNRRLQKFLSDMVAVYEATRGALPDDSTPAVAQQGRAGKGQRKGATASTEPTAAPVKPARTRKPRAQETV